MTRSLSSNSDLQPDAECSKCGHSFKHHYAKGGPCIAAHKLKSGKYAEASVCPCSEFERKP